MGEAGCTKALPSYRFAVWLIAVVLVGCGGSARSSLTAGIGANPVLPAPDTSLIPVVNIAPAKGWPEGARPQPAEGLTVAPFAERLDHPRWLYLLPNGDVLVAETAAPPRPEDNRGLKGWAMRQAMKKTGSAVPSANRITLLRDADGDGRVETRSVFLDGLNSPFGMALVGDQLYVANTDALVRLAYKDGDTRIAGVAETMVALPAGPINHHWTKNVIANADGSKLYVTVGSNSNVAENGIENEKERACILEVDPQARTHRVFASGLRNPNGLAWEPVTASLWTAVNERDELGNDLVPDYITSVQPGGFYGWPFSYFGQHVDERVEPQRPDLVAKAIRPDYAVGAHTAALGLTWSDSSKLPKRFQHGMFVGQHGSWNRKPRSGYRVVFIPFRNGQPSGSPLDVLTGFIDEEDHARGRPVGVAIDNTGALLVADDVGNTVWRVTAAEGQR